MSNGDVKAPVVQLQLERLNALFDDIKELDKKEERVRVRLAPISHLLACHLCQGYLVNATAITECLHVLLRSYFNTGQREPSLISRRLGR